MAPSARSTAPAAALVLALVLSGCNGGGSAPLSSVQSITATPPTTSTAREVTTTARPATARVTVQPAAAFPAELVGVWTGGQETSGRRLTFTADGRFDTERFRGTAVVRGRTMIWQVDGQAPTVVPWSLSGGVLTVGTTTYLRDDERTGGALSLLGTWININGWTTIEFGSDGSFRLDDQANNVVTTGSYVLRGNRLTLTSRTKPTTTYLVALDTFLTFSTPSGQVLGEYTRAG
jgi:hypothetical protein